VTNTRSQHTLTYETDLFFRDMRGQSGSYVECFSGEAREYSGDRYMTGM